MRTLHPIAAVLAAVLFTVIQQCMYGKVHPSQVRFHAPASDTARITDILVEAETVPSPGERVMSVARCFLGVPYVAGTLESEDGEGLTVNLDGMDCTTFVETVLALAKTAGDHRTSWMDFVDNLEGIRYRGGEMDGYPSRLHYASDWIVDNTHRGNLAEITGLMPESRQQERTLDYMSRHPERYPALADSANLAGIKNFEMGYRRHRYPYIPWGSVNGKGVKDKLQEGDVILLTTKTNGLDVTHMGFLAKDEKENPVLLHCSSKAGCVTVEKVPLIEYLRKNGIPGIRVVRLKE